MLSYSSAPGFPAECMARFQAKIGRRERAAPILLINIRFTILFRPPERFVRGLACSGIRRSESSITFLKVTLCFGISHMISFGIMKLYKTNRIYSYKDWECACHGKENCRFARDEFGPEVVNESIWAYWSGSHRNSGHTFHYYDIIGGVAGLEAYGDAVRRIPELGRSCDSILFGRRVIPANTLSPAPTAPKNTQAVRRPR